jgi:hypothetical protein
VVLIAVELSLATGSGHGRPSCGGRHGLAGPGWEPGL